MNFRVQRITQHANGKSASRALLRSTRIPLLGALLACFVGCSTSQLENWTVPPESRCLSLAASIPLERDTLELIVGPNFDPAGFGEDKAGRLQIAVFSCPQLLAPGKNERSTAFALVTVPLARENARIAMAGMGVSDWVALALYIGPNYGRLSRFLRDGSIAVINGTSSVSRVTLNDGERITAKIAFANGELDISAAFACREAPFRRKRVSVGTGRRRFSVLFGEISGSECSSSDVSVEATGDTPFSDLDLTEDGATASLATGISWSYEMLKNTRF